MRWPRKPGRRPDRRGGSRKVSSPEFASVAESRRFCFPETGRCPRNPLSFCDQAKRPLIRRINETFMNNLYSSLIAMMILATIVSLLQTGCVWSLCGRPGAHLRPLRRLWRSGLLSWCVLTVERAFIGVPIIVVPPMARGATPLGTIAR
jgi:hypothetical protein